MTRSARQRNKLNESWRPPNPDQRPVMGPVRVVCAKSLATNIIVPCSHFTGSNERAIEETPQVDVATDASPAAVESSPALDATAHDKTTTASTSKDTTTADQNGADTAEHSSPKIGDNVTGEEETHDSAANNQDEHDDHVVEGEEDTVIY